MKLRIIALAALVLAGAAPCAFAGPDAGWQGYPGFYDIRALGVKCDRSADATAILRAALETGGSMAGKRVFLPSGCKVLLGTPGAGDSVADLATDTTLFCEDSTAGFVLARRMCSGGDTPGGWCDASADCPGGGTCGYETGSAEFAPTPGSTYTVFGSAASSTGQRIENCSIWANQRAGNLITNGNTVNTIYGYCSGGTSTTGSCNQRCTGGSIDGFLCNTGDACGGGTCGSASHCSAGGGTCRIPTDTEVGGPSGSGKIRPIDFNASTAPSIVNVKIYDLRTSDYAVRLGSGGYAERVATNGFTNDSNLFALLSFTVTGAVDVGMNVAAKSTTLHSVARGWRAAYRMVGGSGGTDIGAVIMSSQALAFGNVGGTATHATYPGTVAFLTVGAGNWAAYNSGETTFLCTAGEWSTTGQNTNHFIDNMCDFTAGPLATIFSSHNDVRGNRKAWGGYGSMLSFGEERGRCTAGTRSGLLCLQHASTNATWGCPASACAAHSDFKGAGGGHFQIMENFLHTDQSSPGAFGAYITFDQSKRCAGGANWGNPCTVGGDCPASTCDSLSFPIGQLDSNILYNVLGGSGSIGIDLSSPALATGGLSGISLSNNSISLSTGGTAIKFPTTIAQASQLRAEGNSITGTITAYTSNWAEEMGIIDTQTRGALAGDLGFQAKNLVNRTASLALNSVVEPDVANVDSVKQAVAGTRNAIGCNTFTTPASGTTISVALSGVSNCLVDADNGGTGGTGIDPNVTIGDALAMHPGAAGKLVKAMVYDRVFGYALQAANTDTSIRVALKGRDALFTTERIVADLPAGGCIGTTASSSWDLPTSDPAVAACVGSVHAHGVLNFSDGGGSGATLSAYTSVVLPNPWTGSLFADIWWGNNNVTACNVVWEITGVCVADDDGEDPALSTSASTVTAAVDTTNALDVDKQTITLSTTSGFPLNATTGACAAGETFHMRLYRNPSNVSDTCATSTASLYRVVLRQ